MWYISPVFKDFCQCSVLSGACCSGMTLDPVQIVPFWQMNSCALALHCSHFTGIMHAADERLQDEATRRGRRLLWKSESCLLLLCVCVWDTSGHSQKQPRSRDVSFRSASAAACRWCRRFFGPLVSLLKEHCSLWRSALSWLFSWWRHDLPPVGNTEARQHLSAQNQCCLCRKSFFCFIKLQQHVTEHHNTN